MLAKKMLPRVHIDMMRRLSNSTGLRVVMAVVARLTMSRTTMRRWLVAGQMSLLCSIGQVACAQDPLLYLQFQGTLLCGRWSAPGCEQQNTSRYDTVEEAEQAAERAYPGMSGYTRTDRTNPDIWYKCYPPAKTHDSPATMTWAGWWNGGWWKGPTSLHHPCIFWHVTASWYKGAFTGHGADYSVKGYCRPEFPNVDFNGLCHRPEGQCLRYPDNKALGLRQDGGRSGSGNESGGRPDARFPSDADLHRPQVLQPALPDGQLQVDGSGDSRFCEPVSPEDGTLAGD